MKKWHILVISLLVITSTMFLWPRSAGNSEGTSQATPLIESKRFRERPAANSSPTLNRVRNAAQRKLPDIPIQNQDTVPFAEIDPRIDELDVMEVLLEIETEFGIDIPQDTINQQIGEEHRRDLRSHLSLALIAEFVDGILQNPEQ